MAVRGNQILILRYLSERNESVSGIDIAGDLDWIATSSIYAAITALQAKGMVLAEWDHSESHPRRLITLSKLGLGALADARELESRNLVKKRRLREN